MRKSSFSVGCVAACLIAMTLAEKVLPQPYASLVDLAALRNKEELVLTTGTRLAIAAADLCTRQTPGLGIAVHDLSQYSATYRDAARPMFGRADLPAILAVARGGEADRAGIRAGDGIVAVNANPVPPASQDGLARVETVLARMERAAASGPVRLTLTRNGAEVVRAFTPPSACAVRFQVQLDRVLDARTNGWLIEVTTKLADFLHGPDEMAAVLGHELAHVILEHRRQIDRVSAKQSRLSELDADRLGVRLAYRAGFRPEAALEFWQRMRKQGRSGPSGLGRHPADRERVETVKTALRELAPVTPVVH